MPEWYKKAEHIANMSVLKNNIIWIRKNDKLLLYVPFKLRQKLLYAVHGDLLTGHNGVQKCKERLQECYYWLNMDEDILKHIQECLISKPQKQTSS